MRINTTYITDSVFSVKIYILYSCKKIHIERNHHNPLRSTPLVTVPPSTKPGHAKKKKNLKNNINKKYVQVSFQKGNKNMNI